MDVDDTVRNAFLDTVLSQIETGDPPEARATYERLTGAGQSRNHALHQMVAVLRQEMNRMLEESKPFEPRRYAALLEGIPSEG